MWSSMISDGVDMHDRVLGKMTVQCYFCVAFLNNSFKGDL